MSTGCGLGPPTSAHGCTDFLKRRSLATRSTAQIKPSKSVSQLLMLAVHHRSDGWDGWLRSGRCGLVLAMTCHGRARWLVGVPVFSSYGGRFLMRFAHTGSQWWGERAYANLNRRRAATKPGNGEAARLVLGDGEGGLRWSFGSKDVRQGFLELPSSFSIDQLLWSAAENSNLVATYASTSSWLAAENSHYMRCYI
jgi:hypothetical protein